MSVVESPPRWWPGLSVHQQDSSWTCSWTRSRNTNLGEPVHEQFTWSWTLVNAFMQFMILGEQLGEQVHEQNTFLLNVFKFQLYLKGYCYPGGIALLWVFTVSLPPQRTISFACSVLIHFINVLFILNTTIFSMISGSSLVWSLVTTSFAHEITRSQNDSALSAPRWQHASNGIRPCGGLWAPPHHLKNPLSTDSLIDGMHSKLGPVQIDLHF